MNVNLFLIYKKKFFLFFFREPEYITKYIKSFTNGLIDKNI
jgi:hypothetical protein